LYYYEPNSLWPRRKKATAPRSSPRNGHTYDDEERAANKGFPSAAEQLRVWQAKTSAPYGKDGYLYGGKTKKRKTKKRKTKKRKTKRRKN